MADGAVWSYPVSAGFQKKQGIYRTRIWTIGLEGQWSETSKKWPDSAGFLDCRFVMLEWTNFDGVTAKETNACLCHAIAERALSMQPTKRYQRANPSRTRKDLPPFCGWCIANPKVL